MPGAADAPVAPPPVAVPTAVSVPEGEPILAVTDSSALRVVGSAGGDFGVLVAGHATPGASSAELSRNRGYGSIAAAIDADVREVARGDPQAGVGIRGHTHRLFDARWLRSDAVRLELVAVVNRLDRRPFDASGCGETRLVYRLGYDQGTGAMRERSRLPMTAIAELRAADTSAGSDCREVARRWFAPAGLRGEALGAWLVSASGPLAPGRLSREQLIQLGVNVQSVRWPSGARPDLSGHAEYMLRAFAWDTAQARYLPRKLENTPDVPRLGRDRSLREELRAWIATEDNFARIDAGTALIPERFLAERVVSVTPRGLARRHNRPFRRLFEPGDFADLAYAGRVHTRSPEALLRRLDGLSCGGCHQSRSIAGFHVLGEDGDDTAAGNALLSALSPHVQGDLARRRAYLVAVARGEASADARPLPERAGVQDDGYGAHCGLGDPGFADWRCAAGLRCDASEAPVGENTVGACLPEKSGVGDPCEPARVVSHADPHRDRVRASEPRPCEGVCEATRVGFPGGMCAASCERLPDDGACGGIAILTDFNACLARRTPFADCVARHVRPASLRACSAEHACRDDYVCARTPSGQGACLPPYFVFQLRVDGHP